MAVVLYTESATEGLSKCTHRAGAQKVRQGGLDENLNLDKACKIELEVS